MSVCSLARYSLGPLMFECSANEYPLIAQRVTQTQIAKYIGVSPEFLSKMRSLMYRRAV